MTVGLHKSSKVCTVFNMDHSGLQWFMCPFLSSASLWVQGQEFDQLINSAFPGPSKKPAHSKNQINTDQNRMDTSVGNIIFSPSQAHNNNNRRSLPFWILRESSFFLSLPCTGHPKSSHRETGRRTWNWVALIFGVVSFTYRTACHGSHKLLFPMERTALSVTGVGRWGGGRM